MGTNTKNTQKIIWITWEKQRRSISLSRLLNADYLELSGVSNFFFRYITSIWLTAFKIIGNRKSVIIVQNPSLVLAFMSTLLGKLLLTRVVVDRHTDKYLLEDGKGLVFRALMFVSNFSIKHASLTIVTNDDLIEKVESLKGKPFILPDPFPEIEQFVRPDNSWSKNDKKKCFVVASWSSDEPLNEIFETASNMPDINVYVSGKPKSEYSELIANKPDNLYLTNYLSDIDYYSLMHECDVVLAITTEPATLVCGGYEALALGKPLLTGDSDSLRNYYGDSAVFTDGSVADLMEKIRYIFENKSVITAKVEKLHDIRDREFSGLLKSLKVLINES